jgi:hypothetical protein
MKMPAPYEYSGYGEPPEWMLLGTIDGQWPVQVLPSEGQAMMFLRNNRGRGHVWRVKVSMPVEMEMVEPQAYMQIKAGEDAEEKGEVSGL